MNTPESSLKTVGSAISDRDRLNWLIKQGPPGACEGIGLNSDAWDNAYCQDPGDDGTVMRAAIDEAILNQRADRRYGRPNAERSHGAPKQ